MKTVGIIGGNIGYRLLRRLSPNGENDYCASGVPEIYQNRSKLEVLFGPEIWDELAGKVVLDFGCGWGGEVIDIAQHGAEKVIGLDLRESVLQDARRAAEEANVAERCVFTTKTDERVDVVLSLDAFEHFEDPAGILRIMRGLIKDNGRAIIMFGPTWYHPIGGHSFSVFPWAHLVFTEKALLRWRADWSNDGATRFGEVDGGLNQMTISRFEQLVAESDFEFETFEAVPIRKLRRLHNRLTREFFSSIVRCRLVPRKRSGN
ncbi:MAG TPA: class I SAM-dependent methyltransferase [Pyrinomonadaceae bacterium]|jgi:SAM-dependent methyltransferase